MYSSLQNAGLHNEKKVCKLRHSSQIIFWICVSLWASGHNTMVLIMCSASSHQKFDILETPSINFDWRQHQTKSVVINPVTQSIHDTTSWWKKGSTFCWRTTLAFHTWLFYFNFYGFKRRTSCNEVSLRCCILLLKWRISVFYFLLSTRSSGDKNTNLII